MNGLLKKVLVVLLVVATVPQVNALGARRSNPNAQRGSMAKINKARAASPVARVNKATNTLGQILEQAEIVCTATGPKAHKERATAKAEIKRLMALLDEKVANAISDDIDIINATGKSADSKKDATDAYHRLVATVDNINAQAKVVRTIKKEQMKVENAPAEKKEEVAAQAVQNIKAAEVEAKQAGYLSRAASGVSSLVTTPVNYVFGEESSKAKTAFYATIGVAAIGGAVYMGVPAMALAKLKAGYDAATLANLYEVPGKIKGAGYAAWNATKAAIGLANEAKGAVGLAMTVASVAQSAYVTAADALKNDPTNPDLIAEEKKAFDAMMAAYDNVKEAKATEKFTNELQLEEQQDILREIKMKEAQKAANAVQEEQQILRDLNLEKAASK